MDADWNMLDALARNSIKFDVILTKMDRLGRKERTELVTECSKKLEPYGSAVLGTSTRENLGIVELRNWIANIVGNNNSNV